jgi:hypothetical protein
VLTGDYNGLIQAIEGFNGADLAWGTASAATITISFWVRSSLTGTFGGAIKNNAGDRSYPFAYTISAVNTWEQKSVTIAGDTSGTWLTNNSRWAYVQIGLGVGSTFSGTAGSWAAANYFSATGAVSVVGTNGATFYITGVQLEAGSTATSFDYRDYGRELAMCQRYACSTFPQGVAWGQNKGTTGVLGLFTQSTSARIHGLFTFPTTMRSTPTITSYNPSRADSGFENISDGGNVAASIASTSQGLGPNSVLVWTTSNPAAVDKLYGIHLSATAEL